MTILFGVHLFHQVTIQSHQMSYLHFLPRLLTFQQMTFQAIFLVFLRLDYGQILQNLATLQPTLALVLIRFQALKSNQSHQNHRCFQISNLKMASSTLSLRC
jgi:hypothetical protein